MSTRDTSRQMAETEGYFFSVSLSQIIVEEMLQKTSNP